MTKICSAIARQQAASDRVERPQPAAPAEAPSRHEMIFGARPIQWQHQNEKARIDTDRAARGSKRVIWTR
jgi:hypothetical protein